MHNPVSKIMWKRIIVSVLGRTLITGKKGMDYIPVVLFTKDLMDAGKPIPVVNIIPMKFVGVPTNQGIKGNMQISLDP